MRGDEPLVIQQRAGHRNFDTTQGYIVLAEAVRHGFGKPFPCLRGALIHTSIVNRTHESHEPTTMRNLSSSSSYLQRGGRDSNPRPPA